MRREVRALFLRLSMLPLKQPMLSLRALVGGVLKQRR